MIAADQPSVFRAGVKVAVSSCSDGTMLDRTLSSRHDGSVVENRRAFCEQVGCRYDDSVYQIITYGADRTYTDIVEVTTPSNEGIEADILYTETPHLPLFLPVADCVATIIYDPVHHRLALAHLGRHSTIANAMDVTINHFITKGSNPSDLMIWMAPSVKQRSYRMAYFDHAMSPEWQDYCDVRDDGVYLDLQGYNAERALQLGVTKENIVISPVDTATSPDYFSHSQGDSDGRFAVVAMINS